MSGRSKEPIFWSLFAGGGMLSAMTTPVLMFLTGLAVPLGWFAADTLSYDRMMALVHFGPYGLIGKGALFVVIFLPMWHAAHRAGMSLIDLGVRGVKPLIMTVSYGAAAAGTVIAVRALLAV